MNPREITLHKVNGLNEAIQIHATDEPGSGGANHRYEIRGLDWYKNVSARQSEDETVTVLFQNGPIKEAGNNGLTNEALLAIVADRLESFQKGPFACDENDKALLHIEEALEVLKSRTQRRVDAGVEGTHQIDPAAELGEETTTHVVGNDQPNDEGGTDAEISQQGDSESGGSHKPDHEGSTPSPATTPEEAPKPEADSKPEKKAKHK